MAEIGEECEQPKPSLWETLASTQGAKPQNNNGWNRSDKWGQSLNDDAKLKSDGWGTSSGLKEPDPLSWTRSRRSPHRTRRRYFRQYREPYCDLRRVSWSNGKKQAAKSPRRLTLCSGREAFRPDWGKGIDLSAGRRTYHPVSVDSHLNYHNRAERNPGNERSSHLLKADLSKSLGTSPVCNNRTRVENENQPGLSSAHIKLSDLNKENRHSGWRPHSPVMTRSRSRPLSPWTLAAHNAEEHSDSKDTDRHLLPNRGSNRWSGERSAFRSRDNSLSTEDKHKRTGRDSSLSPEHKWRKTGRHLDRSRCSERSVSPENRPRNTGWGQGRPRGRFSAGPSRLSRLNRSPGMSPTDTKKKKDGREKKLGFSSPQKNLKQTMSTERGQSDSGQPMPEKRGEKKQPNPSIWDNLAQTQGVPSQNNDGWGQSINNDGQRKSDGSRTYPVQPDLHLSTPFGRTSSGCGRGRIKRNARMSTKWPPIHLMQSISRGANTPRDKTDESSAGRQTDHPNCSDLNKKTGSDRWSLASPNVDGSRSSKVPQESMKNPNQKESDGWGQNYSPIRESRSRSLTRFSQAAVDTNNNNKETDRWDTALDQTCPDAWNWPSSNLSPDRGRKRYPYYYSPLVSTACSGGTDAVMQPISCTYIKMGTSRARGSDTKFELSAVNLVDPTPEVTKMGQSQLNENLVAANRTTAVEKTDEADNHSFQQALLGFAKPKLKPFWLKQHLKDADYRHILRKFVTNVTRSLGTCAPQTLENSCKHVKEQDYSLSKCLQMYLGRFVGEDIIKNEKSMVFP